nr:MAG TPA: hypothetical protein [Caudoviricetes sp.]
MTFQKTSSPHHSFSVHSLTGDTIKMNCQHPDSTSKTE